MQITLELPSDLQVQLVNAAKEQHLNLNDYIIQCLLQNLITNKQPNHETQQVIEDARIGKNLEKISLNELKTICDA